MSKLKEVIKELKKGTIKPSSISIDCKEYYLFLAKNDEFMKVIQGDEFIEKHI